jgi:hypothetical protein
MERRNSAESYRNLSVGVKKNKRILTLASSHWNDFHIFYGGALALTHGVDIPSLAPSGLLFAVRGI